MDAYHELAASYDRLTNDVDYEATVEFYYEILKQEGLTPRTAVDLACGTGSVTAILAKKGLRVIGVDMSEEMLTVAQQKASDLENQPFFLCQPLQELYLPRAVDMAVCALDSLDYINKTRPFVNCETYTPICYRIIGLNARQKKKVSKVFKK